MASAQGLMSSTSKGQAPARWQPITLRTVSPQASRVVRPTRGQVAEQVGYPLQLDEVELDVLAGGQVAPAPAVAVGDAGQHVQLLGGDVPVGALDPHHLVVAALALAVDPVVEPENPESVLVHPAGQVISEQPLELLDVGRDLGIGRGRGELVCTGSVNQTRL